MLFDVSAFRRNADKTITHAIIDENNNGSIVTGIEKLAQRFILKLMTRKGSMLYRPKEGTYFVDVITNGKASSESSVFTAFAAASLMITSSMRGEDADYTDEESIQSAKLSKLIVTPGKVLLNIKITNKVGQSIDTVLPLKFSVGE